MRLLFVKDARPQHRRPWRHLAVHWSQLQPRVLPRSLRTASKQNITSSY